MPVMSSSSLSAHLAEIGEMSSRSRLSFRGDFYVLPPSGRLSEIMRAMISPKPAEWTKPDEGEFSNHDWTEECQGVTHDDTYWYISSNKDGKQRVYRLSLANKIVSYVKLAGNGSSHLGDIDYYKGRIYCPMEHPVKIVIIDTPPFDGWRTAGLVGESGGQPPQEGWCAWCAINPWNDMLYSSMSGDDAPGIDKLFAYRFDSATGNFIHTPSSDILLQEKLRKVSGASFSKNGHILIASNHSNDIRCYSILNGCYLGRAPIQKDDSWNVQEEIEGLAIWEGISYNNIDTHVHVILLDMDEPDDDDVYFKHYRVPLSNYL
jgi:hypothetical protein